MELPAPPAPPFASGHGAATQVRLRYEDITQDGHLQPIALSHAFEGLWREVLRKHPGAHAARKAGIVPLLTRMVMEATDATIRVDHDLESTAGFEVAHSLAPGGTDIARIHLNTWAEVRAPAGKMWPPTPAGALVVAGRIFAEHTFTRPFAPPDQRRVTRLDVAGFPPVPETRYAAPAPATVGDAPAGATWLGELVADPAEICFGLDHTDSNQHVNSLVYIRGFLEAVQRSVAAAGRPLRVRSRAVEIAYRKPSFAGERVRAHVRLFALGETLGAAGVIAGADDGKPRCYVRTLLATAT